MAVVKESLAALSGRAGERQFFLEKLAASGRGEQDPEKTDGESRRVIFKIRVKAHDQNDIERRVAIP